MRQEGSDIHFPDKRGEITDGKPFPAVEFADPPENGVCQSRLSVRPDSFRQRIYESTFGVVKLSAPMKILLFLCCLLPGYVFSQSISGTVRDVRQEPLPGASVRLLSARDSAQVNGVVTSSRGTFVFERVPDGIFVLKITSLGMKPYVSTPLTVDAAHPRIALPAIILLSAGDKQLREVTVTAKRPLIETELDKTIVNVDAMIGSASQNSLEILEKTPGVSVEPNGEIRLNGMSSVLVLIDGKPTYLSGRELADYLKSLPGGALDRLELITNPSAKYDANGNAVINIRLRRNRQAGIYGSFSTNYNQGIVGRGSQSATLNYNRRKLSLSGIFSYSKDDYWSLDRSNRTYLASGSDVTVRNENRSRAHSLTARLGLDYAFSERTNAGISVETGSRPRNDRQDYRSVTRTRKADSTGFGRVTSDGDRDNVSVYANFQHRFRQSGHELSAEANYLSFRNESNQWTDRYTETDTLIRQPALHYLLPTRTTLYIAKADYQLPLSKTAAFEAGAKWNSASNDNDFRSFVGSEEDYTRSNHFLYDEQISAVYTNARKSWKRLKAQVGLRLEHTNLTGRQLGNREVQGSRFHREYSSLFPSGTFSYSLDSAGRHTLSLSASRRINRPGYNQLNPFLFYVDNYSYSTGNPTLLPAFQNQFELSYRHGQRWGLQFRYGRFRDIIFSTTEVVGETFISRPANVAAGQIMILSGNTSLNPVKGWDCNINIAAAHMALIRSEIYGQQLTPSTFTARFSVYNRFQFSKLWSGELTGQFNGRDINGQIIRRSRYGVNAGIMRKLWKDTGSIRLSVDDIFYTMKARSYAVALAGTEASFDSEYDTRRVALAFTYRFGKEIRKRGKTENSDEERQRVN